MNPKFFDKKICGQPLDWCLATGFLGAFSVTVAFALVVSAVDYVASGEERAIAQQEERLEEARDRCNAAWLKYESDLTIGSAVYAEEQFRSNSDAAYCR